MSIWGKEQGWNKMADYQVKKLDLKDFNLFYSFASDFILNKYQDYPPEVRKKYLEIDLEKKQLKKDLKKGKAAVVVASHGENIIGFAILNFELGGGVHVQWLAVAEKYQGQGIGSQLLELIEEVAREHKCHFIILYTESEKNIKFYEKRGYQFIGLQRESWYGMNENLMQKNISKPYPID